MAPPPPDLVLPKGDMSVGDWIALGALATLFIGQVVKWVTATQDVAAEDAAESATIKSLNTSLERMATAMEKHVTSLNDHIVADAAFHAKIEANYASTVEAQRATAQTLTGLHKEIQNVALRMAPSDAEFLAPNVRRNPAPR